MFTTPPCYRLHSRVFRGGLRQLYEIRCCTYFPPCSCSYNTPPVGIPAITYSLFYRFISKISSVSVRRSRPKRTRHNSTTAVVITNGNLTVGEATENMAAISCGLSGGFFSVFDTTRTDRVPTVPKSFAISSKAYYCFAGTLSASTCSVRNHSVSARRCSFIHTDT